MWSVAMIGSLPRRAESASLESRENVKRTAPVRKLAKSKVGASVARCPRTPPDAAKTPGLQIGLSNRVTRPEQPEHSCRLQLLPWPDNGGTMPSKSSPFTPSSILFRPRIQRTETRCRITDKPFCSLTSDVRPLVEAPGTAPGSAGFITMAVYRHSRIAPTEANIGTSFADEK